MQFVRYPYRLPLGQPASVLESSIVREPVIPQLTASQFLSWADGQEAKFELHRGFVLSFAGGTIDHDTIAFNMRVLLAQKYPAPCRTFGSDVKVRVAEDTIYYADVGVVCDEVSGKDTIVDRPRIIVEVLSPSTHGYDLVEKRASYRGLSSLVAYVVVHATMRRLDIDERTSTGEWQTQSIDGGEAYCDGRALSLPAIYARTRLGE